MMKTVALGACFLVACSTAPNEPPADAALAGQDATGDVMSTPEVSPTEVTAETAARPLNSPGTDALIAQMKKDDAKGYQTSVDDGVQFFPTGDGQSFYGYWLPPGFDPKTNGFIVSLHGHGTWVSSEYANAWKRYLKARKYGFIGLQWWFGKDQTNADYYLPSEIYPEFQRAITERKVVSGKLLLHGFSRGSTQTYALTAMDKASASPLFRLSIANAGGASVDYPPNGEIVAGKYGALPFKGTTWVLFCGGKDEDPEKSGCIGMGNTRTWIEKYCGTIDLFINDPSASHGGFHLIDANANAALDRYDALTGFTH